MLFFLYYDLAKWSERKFLIKMKTIVFAIVLFVVGGLHAAVPAAPEFKFTGYINNNFDFALAVPTGSVTNWEFQIKTAADDDYVPLYSGVSMFNFPWNGLAYKCFTVPKSWFSGASIVRVPCGECRRRV